MKGRGKKTSTWWDMEHSQEEICKKRIGRHQGYIVRVKLKFCLGMPRYHNQLINWL